MLAGGMKEATQVAGRALELAKDTKEAGNQAWALRLLGEVAAQTDPPTPGAEASYREAIALAETLGMRPLQAHCHLGLGTLYRRIGRPDEARTELSFAAEEYRAMEMGTWLARAESELALA